MVSAVSVVLGWEGEGAGVGGSGGMECEALGSVYRFVVEYHHKVLWNV